MDNKDLKVQSVTFSQLEDYAKNNVPPPHWSFQWEGVPVTHENDDCYLFGGLGFRVERDSPEVRWTKADGSDAHYAMDGCNVMTVSQALAEGYTKYGRGGEQYQSLQDIEDLQKEPEHWPHAELYVAGKETFNPSLTSNEELQEWLATMLDDSNHDDVGDDTGAVYDAIKAVDFSDTANQINEALQTVQYLRLTNIRLVQG